MCCTQCLKYPLSDPAESEYISKCILANERIGPWWSVLSLCLCFHEDVHASGLLALITDNHSFQQAWCFTCSYHSTVNLMFSSESWNKHFRCSWWRTGVCGWTAGQCWAAAPSKNTDAEKWSTCFLPSICTLIISLYFYFSLTPSCCSLVISHLL